MRKIVFWVLVVCLVGAASGCANKGLTRVTDELDRCIGQYVACVKSIYFEPHYDYNKAIYLWDFEQANELPDGGTNYFYMLKSELVLSIRGLDGRFRREYMKVMINKDDVMTGYERVYEIE